MRKILLFPCLLVALSALCQIPPKLKDVKTKPEFNKNTIVLSRQLPAKEITKNKEKLYKKSNKKLTASKPTDHLLDLKHEPE